MAHRVRKDLGDNGLIEDERDKNKWMMVGYGLKTLFWVHVCLSAGNCTNDML